MADIDKYIDIPRQSYRCSVCKRLLVDPRMLKCGHRVCVHCMKSSDVFTCDECHETYDQTTIKIDKACKNDMGKTSVQCKACSWHGNLNDVVQHIATAHAKHEDQGVEQNIESTATSENEESSHCVSAPMKCRLFDDGCCELFAPEKKQEHCQSKQHQFIILKTIAQRGVFDEKVIKALNSNKDKAQMFTPMSSNDNKFQGRHLKREDFNKYDGKYEYLHEAIETIDSFIETSKKDVEYYEKRISTTNGTIKQLASNVEAQQKISDNRKQLMEAININSIFLQETALALNQKARENFSVSYDGSFLWIIPNYSTIQAAAREERQISIYSKPFYSSPNGYKMCIRLYPFGDGSARNTHLSIFFILMKTPHDNLLEFPFKKKVNFCVYDQTGQGDHFFDSFRPDENSNSFKKPTLSMNIASGIPRFIPLEKLQTDGPYIKNDRMFVQIYVDFQNVPRDVIQNAFRMNPAMPMKERIANALAQVSTDMK